MTRKLTVQWHPSDHNDPVKVYDENGMPFEGAGIENPTDFEFAADYAKSDPGVAGFTISLNPNSTDVKIANNDASVVRCTARYLEINRSIAFNLRVKRGSDGAQTQGGKPIIRNDPRRPFQGWVVAVGVLVALVIVAVLVLHYL
jgi:hypothetical protein